MKTFTEKDTEEFYDHEDEIYRSFWDEKGSLHWGLFTKGTKDYLTASKNLTDIMGAKSKINVQSNMLDLGCGNGEVTIQLAKKYGCHITGIDLSGVRIKNAVQKINANPGLAPLVNFRKASATALPSKNEVFSHVWTQATIYHVQDKDKALSEIFRVLKQGGTFVFDDLIKPKKDISEDSQKFVYERLLFDTPFSFESYQKKLDEIGFEVVESEDISAHLKKSYETLEKILKRKVKMEPNVKYAEDYKKLAFAYQKMVEAIDKKELGWALFVCKKR